MPDISCRLSLRSCRARIRKYVNIRKSRFRQSSYGSLDMEKASPSNPMNCQSSGTDGGPLVIMQSMSAEIEDSDELYRVSFSSGESRNSSRSTNFQVNNGGPMGIRRVESGRSQGDLDKTVASRPQTETSRPGTASSMLSQPINSRPGTACSTRHQTANSEEMPSLTRVKSDLERIMEVVDPEKPGQLRLLSLDGGGIRGLSGLYILREIMQELDRIVEKSAKRPLRPCDYFDLIGGTSTGGLMAVMLGILEMDVESCIEEYLKLSPQIFPMKNFVSRSKFGKGFKVLSGSTLFEAAPLEAAIKKLIIKWLGNRATNGEETLLQFEANNGGPKCRVFVTATDYSTSKHVRLRNYNDVEDLMGPCTIWQACRATSAAPTFFKPIRLHDSQIKLVDGGLGYNNPIRAVTNEAWEIWHGKREIGCIISVGTGVLPQYSVGGSGELGKLATYFLKSGTDAEKTAIEIKRELAEKFYGRGQLYWRFNVTTGVGHILLDEWQQSDNIKIATEQYLAQNVRTVKHCAWRLQKASAV